MPSDSRVDWSQVQATGAAQEVFGQRGSRITAMVCALPSNTQTIYLGFGNTVANDGTKGIPLEPGDTWSTDSSPCYSGPIWVNSPDATQQFVKVEVG